MSIHQWFWSFIMREQPLDGRFLGASLLAQKVVLAGTPDMRLERANQHVSIFHMFYEKRGCQRDRSQQALIKGLPA